MGNRRDFIKQSTVGIAATIIPSTLLPAKEKEKTRVLIWDERQPEALKAYGDYLGNSLAVELRKNPDFHVSSVALDDAGQGIESAVLSNTDVLIWWGHLRHGEISIEKSKEIVGLISSGRLAFIGLHSAHWSNPFVEALNEVTRQRMLQDHKGIKEEDITFARPELRKKLPLPGERVGPYTDWKKFPDGKRKLEVHLPSCVFPYVANDGKPSQLKAMKQHPVLKGLPRQLSLSQTEMYGEPFHVPDPDDLLLEEYWEDGNWFRAGMLWNLGKGKVFYFRPGHETYPIFREKWVIQLLQNAISWLAVSKK